MENDNKVVMSKHLDHFDNCYYNYIPLLAKVDLCDDCRHFCNCEASKPMTEAEELEAHADSERAEYYASINE